MDILAAGLDNVIPGQQIEKKKSGQEEAGFGEIFKNALDEVNALQQQSSEMKTKLLTGDLQDLSQVTIAAEKADLSFRLTMEIRNKVIEAYQEIMRMQV